MVSRRILSAVRLPFRHTGVLFRTFLYIYNLNLKINPFSKFHKWCIIDGSH